MATRYDVLFRPLQIGPVTIKNRFCVGPLTLPSLFDGNGAFNDEALAYFEARARGGFGLIFTGALHPDHLVDPVHPLDSKWPLKTPKAFQRSAAALLERLDVYGTKMFPQLSLGLGRNAVGCLAPSLAPYAFAPDRTAPALTPTRSAAKSNRSSKPPSSSSTAASPASRCTRCIGAICSMPWPCPCRTSAPTHMAATWKGGCAPLGSWSRGSRPPVGATSSCRCGCR